MHCLAKVILVYRSPHAQYRICFITTRNMKQPLPCRLLCILLICIMKIVLLDYVACDLRKCDITAEEICPGVTVTGTMVCFTASHHTGRASGKISARGSGGISDIESRADRQIYWCHAVDNKTLTDTIFCKRTTLTEIIFIQSHSEPKIQWHYTKGRHCISSGLKQSITAGNYFKY